VAKRDAVGPRSDRKTIRQAANDRALPVGVGSEEAGASKPANDNPALEGLPPCLPIMDEEVRLLHRYLGEQILGLFA